MAVADVALTARARGVASHLLSRGALEELSAVPDLATLAHRLAITGVVPDTPAGPLDVFAVERAAAHAAETQLRILCGWQGGTTGALQVFLADVDRRSLRAVLRGAAQGAPRELRLRGLLPTPLLPSPVLTLLAALTSPQAVVHELLARRYPDAERLLPAAGQTASDLLAIEAALLDGFVRRAARASASTDRPLREFVVESIDVGNAINALLVAGDPRDADPGALFVAGGRWLTRDTFAAAVSTRARHLAAGVLAAACVRSPLAAILTEGSADVARIERVFLETTLLRLQRAARRDPLSTAPVLRVLLLIAVQIRDLRALAWGAALAVPPTARSRQLVTPR